MTLKTLIEKRSRDGSPRISNFDAESKGYENPRSSPPTGGYIITPRRGMGARDGC